jgi:hypothetical protein
MHTPDFKHAAAIAGEIGWKYDLAQLRTDLLEHGLRGDVALARTSLPKPCEGSANIAARKVNLSRVAFRRRCCLASKQLPPILASSVSIS